MKREIDIAETANFFGVGDIEARVTLKAAGRLALERRGADVFVVSARRVKCVHQDRGDRPRDFLVRVSGRHDLERFSVVGEPNVAVVAERRYKTLVAGPGHVAANDLGVVLYRADFVSRGGR
jgi:hypothetical protein